MDVHSFLESSMSTLIQEKMFYTPSCCLLKPVTVTVLLFLNFFQIFFSVTSDFFLVKCSIFLHVQALLTYREIELKNKNFSLLFFTFLKYCKQFMAHFLGCSRMILEAKCRFESGQGYYESSCWYFYQTGQHYFPYSISMLS